MAHPKFPFAPRESGIPSTFLLYEDDEEWAAPTVNVGDDFIDDQEGECVMTFLGSRSFGARAGDLCHLAGHTTINPRGGTMRKKERKKEMQWRGRKRSGC